MTCQCEMSASQDRRVDSALRSRDSLTSVSRFPLTLRSPRGEGNSPRIQRFNSLALLSNFM